MGKGIAKIDFAAYLEPGAATLNDRVNEHLLGVLEAAQADNFQASRGALEKMPGHLRLTGVNPTGASVRFAAASNQGVSFPYHAKYNLGLRWAIDVTVKPNTIPGGSAPIVVRADDSNNKVTSLELLAGTTYGRIRFVHRDSNGTEVVLVSPDDGVLASVIHSIRVVRFYENLTIFVDGELKATTSSLSSTYSTAACDNKLYVGVFTETDGDTPQSTGYLDSWVDELRIFREEIVDDHKFIRTAWPWPRDKRLALCARFDESSGAPQDISLNENHGTIIGVSAQGETELVKAVAPVLKIAPFVAADGTTKWLFWAGGNFYSVDPGI